MKGRHLAVPGYGLGDQLDRGLVAAGLMRQDTEQMQCIDVSGIGPQDLTIERFRIVQTSGLMMPHGSGEHLFQPRRWLATHSASRRGCGTQPSFSAFRDEHARAGGAPRLQVGVRLRGVTADSAARYAPAVSWRSPGRTARVRTLQLAAGRDVIEQRRSRQEQRSAPRSSSGAIAGGGPDALPKLTIRPRGRRQSSDSMKVSLPTES